MTPAQAVFATTPYALGGVCAAIYLGVLIDRFGPQRALAMHYAIGAGFIALIALVAMPYLLLLAVIFFAGLTIIGSQTGLNGACGKLYPARMRTSGLGWAIGVRGVCGNKSRCFYDLLQEIFVAQEFDFGIEFFFSNVGPGEIHGAGGLGRDDGVKAAAAQQYFEMRFISRREDDEEHRRQHYQPKRSGHEPRTPEERGRQVAERQGKWGLRVSVQFRGHGSYSKADHTRRALGELARF